MGTISLLVFHLLYLNHDDQFNPCFSGLTHFETRLQNQMVPFTKINRTTEAGLLIFVPLSINGILVIALFFPSSQAMAANDILSILSFSRIQNDIYPVPGNMWILFAFFMGFFCLIGVGLIYSGSARAKNVLTTFMMAVLVFCLGLFGYWATGFAIQYGGINYPFTGVGVAPASWTFAPVNIENWAVDKLSAPLIIGGNSVFGLSGFFLSGLSRNNGILVFFLIQLLLTMICAMIPTGVLIERVKPIGIAGVILFVSSFLYPLIGNWVWGGGWLANLGRSTGLGNGVVDFVGSGVIHITAGMTALTGAYISGPRIGKFQGNRSPYKLNGHNLLIMMVGTLLLLAGSFGITTGLAAVSSHHWQDLAVYGCINSLFASASGCLTAIFISYIFSPDKKPVPIIAINGIRAGLVAIAASCIFVEIWEAVIIGSIAGLLVAVTPELFMRLRIDDPVDVIPVHLINGLWGLLAVGIFANANPDSIGWNGVSMPVTGWIYGNVTQFAVQSLAAIIILTAAGIFSFMFFKALSTLGLLRVPADIELEGLDIPVLGAKGYPRDWEPSPTSLKGLPGCKGNSTTKPVAVE
jgi:Amt family ammonium transporter